MEPLDSDPVTETVCNARYPQFAAHATAGERAVLLAIARLRKSLVLKSKGDRLPSTQETKNMFSHCASALKQTGAWSKIGPQEREQIERDLLTVPLAG